MKIGFNLLLWTTHLTEAHRPVLAALKEAGYDGVEVPVFEADPPAFTRIGAMLDDLGLDRTAITVVPDEARNPIGADAAQRAAAVAYLDWTVECTAAMGARLLCGPLHSTLGRFSGRGPTAEERERCLDVHRRVAPQARAAGVTIALEAINRFETYFATTMAELTAYLDALDDPAFAAMYDSFHANIEEKDPVAALVAACGRLAHVHLSENDRGALGSGHVPWAATFAALRDGGYDGWLTIEAFGRALPELAAATRIWRDLDDDRDAVWRDGVAFIRAGMAAQPGGANG